MYNLSFNFSTNKAKMVFFDLGTVAKSGGWLLEVSEKEQYFEDFVEAFFRFHTSESL